MVIVQFFVNDSLDKGRIMEEKQDLDGLYLKFLEEKKQFQEEMKIFNKQVLEERKRLKEEELFFEKKMEILKGGFAQLEADRKSVEKERILLEAERTAMREHGSYREDGVRLFFRGVSNPLTLKKRYRDLIKIFHPDNLCGDTELLQRINRTYDILVEEIGWQKKA